MQVKQTGPGQDQAQDQDQDQDPSQTYAKAKDRKHGELVNLVGSRWKWLVEIPGKQLLLKLGTSMGTGR